MEFCRTNAFGIRYDDEKVGIEIAEDTPGEQNDDGIFPAKSFMVPASVVGVEDDENKFLLCFDFKAYI